MAEDQPPGWGSDPLSGFIDQARHNAFATFHNLKGEYWRLQRTDAFFRALIQYLNNPRPWYVALFLLRAHSSFLTSAYLAMTGQIVEAYMTMRGCLEASLYGLYLNHNPDAWQTWRDRHKDEEANRKCRDEFAGGRLLGFLGSRFDRIHQVTSKLYVMTIDFGAHPNELAFFSHLVTVHSDDSVELRLQYLNPDDLALRVCLKNVAQVGVCALDIFSLIYPERMAITGLSEQLDQLKAGL